ncbi:metallophosphoesterase [Halorientalis brevis]|uniref:Metallophosphoesterase n=1 Tax=Halorientalis brevis TaxID=1126241 RepID=A0ABD6CDD0_9EURY|nr:metallophosphoesterase [Halorientalis brevis]
MTRTERDPRKPTRRRTIATVGSLALGATLSGCRVRPPESAQRRFSIVVLPDTQHYSRLDNGLFEQQARWIVDNQDEHDVAAVLHLGDLVDNPAEDSEWDVATDAVSMLDDAGIPTLVALGNHDAAEIRAPTAFRRRLPTARYATAESRTDSIVGYGTYDGNPENAYLRQRVAGEDLLYLTVEFGPRQAVVEWADRVLSAHSDALAFLTTHSYLYFDDTRVDRDDDHNPRQYGLTDVHNGVELWAELVRNHANLVNVHSGHHVPGNTGRRLDDGGAGTAVSQMFVNYQTERRGGNGWLRLLTVDPDRRRLAVSTYSPALDRWQRGADAEFDVFLATKRGN